MSQFGLQYLPVDMKSWLGSVEPSMLEHREAVDHIMSKLASNDTNGLFKDVIQLENLYRTAEKEIQSEPAIKKHAAGLLQLLTPTHVSVRSQALKLLDDPAGCNVKESAVQDLIAKLNTDASKLNADIAKLNAENVDLKEQLNALMAKTKEQAQAAFNQLADAAARHTQLEICYNNLSSNLRPRELHAPIIDESAPSIDLLDDNSGKTSAKRRRAVEG